MQTDIRNEEVEAINTIGLGSISYEQITSDDDVCTKTKSGIETPSGTLVSITSSIPEEKPISTPWIEIKSIDIDPSFEKKVQYLRDSDGKIEIPCLKPGIYYVEVSEWGRSIHKHEIEIKQNQKTIIEDNLFMAGAIRWTLHDVNGNPIENVKATLQAIDSGSPTQAQESVTDSEGTAIFRGLFQGAYNTSHSSQHGTATAKFNVNALQVSGGESVVQ